MIKERSLVPGRVLGRLVRWIDDPFSGQRTHVRISAPGLHGQIAWLPCVVIGTVPDIVRRHAQRSADRQGWDVLVLWLSNVGTHNQPWEQVRIEPNSQAWKVLW